jgi:hypothetical protein
VKKKARASILMRGYGLIKSVLFFFKKIEISITKGYSNPLSRPVILSQFELQYNLLALNE